MTLLSSGRSTSISTWKDMEKRAKNMWKTHAIRRRYKIGKKERKKDDNLEDVRQSGKEKKFIVIHTGDVKKLWYAETFLGQTEGRVHALSGTGGPEVIQIHQTGIDHFHQPQKRHSVLPARAEIEDRYSITTKKLKKLNMNWAEKCKKIIQVPCHLV